jgi:predicted transcriptional regulator
VEEPLTQQLLQIAEELIIRKNRILSPELLYNCAQRRLKRPRHELIQVIQWLFGKRVLIEGSKLTRELVLRNLNRRKIYKFIEKHISVTFSRLKLGLTDIGSPGQLIWHLQMLMKFKYIRRFKFKKYSLFTPIEIDEDMAILIFLLEDEINKKIITLLLEYGSLRRTEFYEALKASRQLIYYHINILIEAGLITQKQEANGKIELNSFKYESIMRVIQKEEV